MKKLYITLRQDFFLAMALNQIPEDCKLQAGSLWMVLALTDDEKAKYTFPIRNFS